jgi:hypothetical protein
MRIAVTNHAVERYQERVPGASKLNAEAVRNIIRSLYVEAVENNTTREHPGYPDRAMVPFSAGREQMFLAVGPNKTKFPGDIAVLGVLYDREVGRSGVASIGDHLSEETKQKLAQFQVIKRTKFLIRINRSTRTPKEVYDALDEEELECVLKNRAPDLNEVEIFQRVDLKIQPDYTLKKS